MRRRSNRVAVLAALCAAATLVAAGPASARTWHVAGEQTVVDLDAGTYTMAGGLIGDWQYTSFTELARTPVYRAKGTETFTGCLDRNGNGSCRGEPSGTLTFSFRYWSKFVGDDPTQAVLLGTCAHPVLGGTGDFSKASGFLQMVDTPDSAPPYFFRTEYEGVIVVGRGKKAAAKRSRASSSTRPAAVC